MAFFLKKTDEKIINLEDSYIRSILLEEGSSNEINLSKIQTGLKESGREILTLEELLEEGRAYLKEKTNIDPNNLLALEPNHLVAVLYIIHERGAKGISENDIENILSQESTKKKIEILLGYLNNDDKYDFYDSLRNKVASKAGKKRTISEVINVVFPTESLQIPNDYAYFYARKEPDNKNKINLFKYYSTTSTSSERFSNIMNEPGVSAKDNIFVKARSLEVSLDALYLYKLNSNRGSNFQDIKLEDFLKIYLKHFSYGSEGNKNKDFGVENFCETFSKVYSGTTLSWETPGLADTMFKDLSFISNETIENYKTDAPIINNLLDGMFDYEIDSEETKIKIKNFYNPDFVLKLISLKTPKNPIDIDSSNIGMVFLEPFVDEIIDNYKNYLNGLIPENEIFTVTVSNTLTLASRIVEIYTRASQFLSGIQYFISKFYSDTFKLNTVQIRTRKSSIGEDYFKNGNWEVVIKKNERSNIKNNKNTLFSMYDELTLVLKEGEANSGQ